MTAQAYKTVPVNGARMRAARLTQRIGTRDLARDAGTNIMVINLMEKENRAGAQMSLADARRLASCVGLNLTDLLTEPPTRPDEEPTPEVTEDARLVIQLLALDTRLHERDDLADALGWTIPRTDAAIAIADTLLEHVGLRITRANTRRGIRPTDSRALKAYERHLATRSAKNGMNAAAARLTLAALERQGLSGEPTDADKPNLGFLINVGVLRPGQTGEPFHVLTDEARFAFEVT
jgi:hypothetical protein